MSSNDVKNEDLVFSSLNTHFSLPLFVEQISHHMLFPFSLPYFVLKYGFIFLVAHGYYPLKFWSVLGSWILPLAFLLMLYASRVTRHQTGLLYVVPVFFYILHRCMISLKYASLSFTEYKKYLHNRQSRDRRYPTETEISLSQQYIQQIQLIPGWLSPSVQINMFELESAARRLGINLLETYFYVPLQMPSDNPETMPHQALRLQHRVWAKFLAAVGDVNVIGEHVQCPLHMLAGSWTTTGTFPAVRYSAQDVCMATLAHINQGAPKKYIVLLILCAVNVAVTPIITWQFQTDRTKSLWVVVFYVSALFVTLLTSLPCLIFLVVGTVDAIRKYNAMSVLWAMIQPTPLDTGITFTLTANSTSAAQKRGKSGSRRSSVQLAALTSVNDIFARKVSAVIDDPTPTDGKDDDMIERGEEREMMPVGPMFPISESRRSASLGGRTFSTFVNTNIPLINSNVASNVEAWCACRVVMGNFGARFKNRIDLYLLVMGVVVVASVVTGLFIVSTSQSVGDALRNGTVCQVTFMSIVLLIGFIILVTTTYLTNAKLLEHRGTLGLLVLNKKRELDALLLKEGGLTERALAIEHTYRRSIDSIHDVISSLEQVDLLTPARLFGFTVERHHIVWLISSTGLYLYVVVSFLATGNLSIGIA